MPTEKDFETALAKYPELIEEGLRLIGRQMIMYDRRMDLVFSDRFQRTLITELKWGPIKDAHIGQIMAYEGMLLSSTDPSIRVMLIGTRVPPNLRNSLDHHGIAWKEIPAADLISFLGSKCDLDLLRVFEEATVSPLGFSPKRSVMHSSRTEATKKMRHVADDQAGRSRDSSEIERGARENPHEPSEEPLAKLIAVVNAYNLTAEPDMRVGDLKAKNYRQIVPPGWRGKWLHYEFYQACGRIGAELHLQSDEVVSIGEFLKPFAGRPVADGKGALEWDPHWYSGRNPGRGRLAAFFPLDTSPGTVAAGMRDLISMTREGVSKYPIVFRRDFPR
jgi:hypothetical protein